MVAFSPKVMAFPQRLVNVLSEMVRAPELVRLMLIADPAPIFENVFPVTVAPIFPRDTQELQFVNELFVRLITSL